MAWNDASDSGIASAGDGATSLCPAVPRKLPMTAMSGLKIFDPEAAPFTGSTVPSAVVTAFCVGGVAAVAL